MSRVVIRIVVFRCAVHVPRSPEKLSSTAVTACNQQRTVAIIFKLWTVPGHYCLHFGDSNVLVGRTVYHFGI